MKSFWRWTGTIFFALAFIFLVLTGIGTSLPIDHHAMCFADFNLSPQYLFEAMKDDDASVHWRPDIASVVLISENGSVTVWRETDRHGWAITYRTIADAKQDRLVRTVDFVPGMQFAGTWTIELSPDTPKRAQQSTFELVVDGDSERRALDAALRLFEAKYRSSVPTRVTITEDGKIYNPFFRFLARYVSGYTSGMLAYFRDLRLLSRQPAAIQCESNP